MSNDRFKFRVWRSTVNDYDPDRFKLTPDGRLNIGGLVVVDPENYTIEQCTGLKDKNGKLIYKGDIIKVVDGCVHLGKTFEVVDCMIRWEMRDLSNDEYDTLMCGCCVEIIGNIHEDQFREVTKKVEGEQ